MLFAEPAAPEPELAADATPRIVNGLKVISDEPVASPLSKVQNRFVPFRGRRELTLEDGTKTFACADCEFTGTPGEVTTHRVRDHGARKPGNPTGGRKADATPNLAWMGMTVGELIEVAGLVSGFESDLDSARDEAEREKALRVAAETELRKIKRALEKLGFVLKVEEENE